MAVSLFAKYLISEEHRTRIPSSTDHMPAILDCTCRSGLLSHYCIILDINLRCSAIYTYVLKSKYFSKFWTFAFKLYPKMAHKRSKHGPHNTKVSCMIYFNLRDYFPRGQSIEAAVIISKYSVEFCLSSAGYATFLYQALSEMIQKNK